MCELSDGRPARLFLSARRELDDLCGIWIARHGNPAHKTTCYRPRHQGGACSCLCVGAARSQNWTSWSSPANSRAFVLATLRWTFCSTGRRWTLGPSKGRPSLPLELGRKPFRQFRARRSCTTPSGPVTPRSWRLCFVYTTRWCDRSCHLTSTTRSFGSSRNQSMRAGLIAVEFYPSSSVQRL
jgi:hypothetical protein